MTWKVFDCDGHNPDCTKNQTIPADPDIAGIGIVISFLMTTCLAFLIAFTVIFLDRYPQVIKLYRRYVTKEKQVYTQNYNGPYWRSTDFWSRVLSKNLLAFSDTQLLTGLAIQFTGLLKHCEMRVYHWRIVTELAFLTTVTHLLTVVALRNYFVKYKWINLPRIFFMLANLGLLGYTSYISYSYEFADVDITMDLSCYFKRDRPEIKSAFGTKWTGLIVGAIGGHITIILPMYILNEPKKGSKKARWYKLGAAFRTWIIAPVYSMYGLYMAYDGLRFTQALGTPNIRMEGSESKWNFGQFLPVLLLALPIFAGWESFWEEKDPDRDNRFGRNNYLSTYRERNSPRDGSEVQDGSEAQEQKPMGSEMRRISRSASASMEEREVENTGTVIQEPRLVAQQELSIRASSAPRNG